MVYDECSADLQNLAASNSLRLVLLALDEMGKDSYVLQGECCLVFCGLELDIQSVCVCCVREREREIYGFDERTPL